jgi:putative tryptophan/tyrosine transport system substrate-binding protein
MKRLALTLIFALLAAAAAGQTPAVKRIGWIGLQSASGPLYVAFEGRLRELGWEPGRNLVIDFRRIERPEQYAAAYAQVVADEPHLVLAPGPEQALAAAQAATRKLPVVFIAINFDPVADGYIASLARPGGNLTGIFMQQTEFTAKRVELVREAFPAARAIGVLYDSYGTDFLPLAEAAVQRLGLQCLALRVEDTGGDLESRFRELAAAGAPALMLGSPIFFRERERIGALGVTLRLPIVATSREGVEAGALFHYGPSIPALYRRAADYADKVLRGANPASLPVEQPTHFEMSVNLRTARALGVTLAPALLARADEVIE